MTRTDPQPDADELGADLAAYLNELAATDARDTGRIRWTEAAAWSTMLELGRLDRAARLTGLEGGHYIEAEASRLGLVPRPARPLHALSMRADVALTRAHWLACWLADSRDGPADSLRGYR